MKDILKMMNDNDVNDQPYQPNPLLNPDIKKDKYVNEAELINIHKHVKVSASKGFYDGLAEDLRRNAGYGDYEAVKKATERLDFLMFCDIKDEDGFAAIKWATDLGHRNIVRLLLDSGATSDTAGLDAFINIKYSENDIRALKTINEGDDEDREIGFGDGVQKPPVYAANPTSKVQTLPTTKNEKKEMDHRLSEMETHIRDKTMVFGMMDNIDPSSLQSSSQSSEEHVMQDKPAIRFSQMGNPDEHDKPTSKKNVTEKQVKKKEKTGFAAMFAKNLAKNFNKTGFSDDRTTKLVPPTKEEITPEEIEKLMAKRGLETFAGVSNQFLEEFSMQDVSRYLMHPDKINVDLVDHRSKMCVYSPNKNDIYNSITESFKSQGRVTDAATIKEITETTVEVIKFYTNMYHRLIDFNRVEVRDSSLHGKGVFATRNIKRGDVVTFYFPYFLNYNHADDKDVNREDTSDIVIPILSRRKFNGESESNQYNELFRSTIKIPNNFYLMGDNEFISDSRFLGHMVNDPCDFSLGKPNSVEYERQLLLKANASVVSYTKDRRFIYVGAMRDIDIGEEIFVPYGPRYWDIEVPVNSTI